MNQYNINDFGYFEFIIEAKVKSKNHASVAKYPQSGHYLISKVEKNFISLKEEEIEIPVAKKNIIKFERVNNFDKSKIIV